jgi:hypothetical protein
MWLDALTAIGTFGGFVFLGWQMLLDRKTREFEIYERISTRFSEALWRSVDHPQLHYLWPDEEWTAMEDDDKLAYRYTRLVFDVLEQAWEARDAGLIDDDVWDKWQKWIEAWKTTRWYDKVVDADDPLSPFQRKFLADVRNA